MMLIFILVLTGLVTQHVGWLIGAVVVTILKDLGAVAKKANSKNRNMAVNVKPEPTRPDPGVSERYRDGTWLS